MTAAPTIGRVSGTRTDARTDRWREHRAAVREQLLDETVRAIELFGPDVSVDDIAKTAGVPKPKLYRYFSDKSELFDAVSDRVHAMMLERITPHLELSGPPRDAIRSGLAAYIGLVDEHPNLFRFLVNSHFIDGQTAMERIRAGGQTLAAMGAATLTAIIEAGGGNAGEGVEVVVDALLGAVALGVLRWLNYPTISADELVEQMLIVVWGGLAATLESRGVAITS
ncbi:TetR/AcrR family transcriptional regulator [Nocardiaceae bacterium YC2-7]|uniref:TetR/AcrR family transcriptional regulator n=1 Tax=Antrihabitans stalactiti TaxID=2584121 RepID=A0A848KMA4_9NOCA|nr:TetR/AcrR family transcriptional regulator [Antrihabitans stalactiti]NMN99351.1 TetR/AcrR family transcriptional regulator [Antrihabitans stalactiti]